MWVPLVFAVLFAIGAVFNLIENDRITGNVVGGAALSFFCVQIFLFSKRERERADVFADWIEANLASLQSEGAAFHGTFVDQKTRVTQFHTVFSFLFATVKTPSRYYIVGHDALAAPTLMYTV